MIKLSTSIATILLLACGTTNAQFLTITDHDGNVVNGTELTVWTPDTLYTLGKIGLDATLNLSQTTLVGLKRYEVSALPGTANYFCWNLCYSDWPAGQYPIFDAPDQQSMDPNSTFAGFAGYHVPNEIQGTNTYRYVWYDTSNPSDSVWVDLTFVSTPVGIDETTATVGEFDIFPNPATGASTTIQLKLNDMQGTANIVLHNALGEQIYSKAINSSSMTTELELGSLQQGVYFCSVSAGDKVLRTKRLIISGR